MKTSLFTRAVVLALVLAGSVAPLGAAQAATVPAPVSQQSRSDQDRNDQNRSGEARTNNSRSGQAAQNGRQNNNRGNSNATSNRYGTWQRSWGAVPSNPPRSFTRTSDWYRHVRACQQRYRSYNAATDRYTVRRGQTAICRL